MKQRIVEFAKKPFVRNVATVATGAAAAQAITMAFAPVITRLYGPEAFGSLGVFMAMAAILTPVAALAYPIAIVLPKSDADAKELVRLSLSIAALLAIFVALVLAVFNQPLVSLLQIEAIAPFLYLIPVVMLLAACLQIVQQLLIRKKQFKTIAQVAVAQALILNSAKACVGLFNPAAAMLIILAILGSASHVFMLTMGIKKTQQNQPQEANTIPTSMRELAIRHRDFPFFRSPQVLINAASQSLPVLMLASFYGPAAAGFYSIGRAVLGIPSLLIGNSVSDVFYPRITQAAHDGENLTILISRATLALAAVAVIPFGVVVAFGPCLFSFVFGAEWVTAGEYARWLALWLFFGFINRPSVTAIPILKLQYGLLVYEVFSTSSKLIALLVGFYFFSSDIWAIALFSIFGIVAYVYLIVWVLIASQKRHACLSTITR